MSAIINVESVGSSVLGGDKLSDKKNTTFTPKVIIATAIMLISGTMNTLSFKLENERNFKHGMVQTGLMFFGEYLNILIFGLMLIPTTKRRDHFIELTDKAQKAKIPKNPNPSKLLIALPAFMDSCGSSLQVVPLLLIPASVNQMLRGGVIVFTCLFSKIFLKRQVYRHHLLGVSLLVIGFVLVGVASVVTQSGGSSSVGLGGTIAGILMVLVSLLIQAAQFVLEETIITKNEISAQRMVGMEGIFGMIFIFMWIMIFSYIPCPSSDMCDMYSGFEDPIAGVIQIFSDKMLLMWCCITIISIMLFNVNGLILTQNVSSVFRAFWDATRTILVWILSLAFGIDSFDIRGFFLQMAGFVLLLLGNFIYNEILTFKCCGMDKYLKINLREDGTLKTDAKKEID